MFFEHVDRVDHRQRIVARLSQKLGAVSVGLEFLLARFSSNRGSGDRVAKILDCHGARAECANPPENVAEPIRTLTFLHMPADHVTNFVPYDAGKLVFASEIGDHPAVYEDIAILGRLGVDDRIIDNREGVVLPRVG